MSVGGKAGYERNAQGLQGPGGGLWPLAGFWSRVLCQVPRRGLSAGPWLSGPVRCVLLECGRAAGQV